MGPYYLRNSRIRHLSPVFFNKIYRRRCLINLCKCFCLNHGLRYFDVVSSVEPTARSPELHYVMLFNRFILGTVIQELIVSDSDTGDNGKFDFYIEKASEKYQFKIKPKDGDPNTAVITLDWKLDREEQSEYYLQIIAKDRG